ncbi:MAG: TlpA disulfide reductase family protein [Chitinophagales bacterium]
MKKLILLVSLCFYLVSCNSAGGDNKFLIEGKLDNGSGKTIYLEKLTLQTATLIDTAKVDAKGNFRINNVADKGFYRLRSDDKMWLLLLENATYKADLNYNNVMAYTITGPASNTEFQQAVKDLTESQMRLNKSNELFYQAQNGGASNDSLQKLAVGIQQQGQNFENGLKQKSQAAKDPLVALYYASFLRMDRYPEENRKMVQRLEKEMPKSSYTAEMRDQFNAFEQQQKAQEMARNAEAATANGAVAPDFEFNTPEGKPLKLSSTRGKIVLLDFWASWCGPCRRENPNVVAAYNKFKDKGFTVFSVSLDQDAGRWKSAIQQDGLIWPNHVSDLKGWGSIPAKMYGVNSIPAQFLLDKDGKIIGRNLRGDELDRRLSELLH